MIIKCKMCGGDIDFIPGATCGICEHCGNVSTIPKVEDEGSLEYLYVRNDSGCIRPALWIDLDSGIF